jgi:sterol desaturase/sphingolipid hydroxylase (fatty acid hydroxylase superfamily)
MQPDRGSRWPAAIVGATIVGLLILERFVPLRRSFEPRLRHDLRNLAVAALAAASLAIVEKPVVGPLAGFVERHRFGLLPRSGLPASWQLPIAAVLCDYTLYLWHILLHRWPLLWRFHLAHHVDLDLTATTALRFHFGELLLSVPWRAAQVLLIGVSPAALRFWQTATLGEILFHHSNLRLPRMLERVLCRIVVTPRLHGIHHSTLRDETESNWSSGLTLWDWLHGTLRLEVPLQRITIGVPAYRDPGELRLPVILAMPFLSQRPAWQQPTPCPRTEILDPASFLREDTV